KLKRLLEQRWTGHYCTVGVVMKSFNSIVELLSEIQSTRGHGTEVKIEAIGLLKQVSAVDFKFIAHMVQKNLSILDTPNKMLQEEKSDLLSAVEVVHSASECILKLRCDAVFNDLLNDSGETTVPCKKQSFPFEQAP
ncbi:UNVERIFIED_CONTAM: hypothetical protein FKN15_057067, partial [Acipenser sinensis]